MDNISNKRNYHFEVETIESGQRRKYGDSYYHYIVENISEIAFNKSVIELFCRGFLKPAVKSKDDQKCWSNTYMTEFRKVDDRKFVYKCVSPSTH